MTKDKKKFKVDDKVFAKVKGYPAWPAKIVGINGKKYDVKFYGTQETGKIFPENIFYYLKYKKEYVKGSNRRLHFDEAVEEIEEDIEEAGGTDGDNNNEAADDSAASETESKKGVKRKRSSVGAGAESHTSKLSRKGSSGSEKTIEEEKDVEDEELKDSEESLVKDDEVKIKNLKAEDDKDIEEKSEVGDAEKIQLIPELYISILKLYAKKVKANENIFKEKSPDGVSVDSSVSADSVKVLPVKLPSEKYVGIRYIPPDLSNYKSEYDRALEDERIANQILDLKTELSSGAFEPDSSNELLILDLQCVENKVHHLANERLLEYKKSKMEWLLNESMLFDCTLGIKKSLGLDKADPKEAIQNMNCILQMHLDPLMLKKFPQFVDTVRRLRRYVGNIKLWKLNDAELAEFKADAKIIREVGERVYKKFKSLFPYANDEKFHEAFRDDVAKLKEATLEFSEAQTVTLWAEPNTRKFLLDEIYDNISSEEDIKHILKGGEIMNTI